METLVKVNERSNDKITAQLLDFPYFTIRCRLAEILEERGMKMKELSELTGVRIAVISEMANMKRSSMSVPHILVLAKALRLTDISELFEFIMPEDTYNEFKRDQEYIEQHGMLPEQDKQLAKLRKDKKKKPTVS